MSRKRRNGTSEVDAGASKSEQICVVKNEGALIDLEDDGDDDAAIVAIEVAKPQKPVVSKPRKKVLSLEEEDIVAIEIVKPSKSASKAQRSAKDKTKGKREKAGDRSRSRHKGKEKKDKGGEKEKSHKRSSSSGSSSSSSDADPYQRFKPYSKVVLRNLVRKAELNGMTGQVVHPSVAVCPCPPGCLLVRLESGREIAVKPPNLMMIASFHQAPPPVSQEQRLHQVLTQIRLNVDNCEDGIGVSSASCAIFDASGSAGKGGVGHVL